MAAAKKKAKAPEPKVFISEADQYLFAQGTHYDIYKKLGAHPSEENGEKGMFFGVWAPNAESVHVIGTFNGWDENMHRMDCLPEGSGRGGRCGAIRQMRAMPRTGQPIQAPKRRRLRCKIE